jgi:hypothetical protein
MFIPDWAAKRSISCCLAFSSLSVSEGDVIGTGAGGDTATGAEVLNATYKEYTTHR